MKNTVALFGLIALLIMSINLSYGTTSIISYNMGQLTKKGIRLVSCAKKRLPQQIHKIFNDENSPIYDNEYFVMGLRKFGRKGLLDL